VRRRKVKRKRFQLKKRKVFQKLQRNRRWFSFISLCIAFLFFVAGCGGSPSPSSPPQKAKSPAVEKKGETAKAAEKKELEKKEETAYAYNPVGKADPFKPFMQLASVRESSKSVPLTPLQKYEISQLKLVAIIATPEGNFALVEDSAGKGYFLKKGTGIGKNDGKVKRILRDRVIVEEIYEDIFGQRKVNEISLFLHRVEEGGEA
jgi:type IV pilus assembly protein PilP